MLEKFIHADEEHVTEEQVQRAKDEAAFLAAKVALLEINPIETRRQCTAVNRSGTRCGRAPIPGGTVCDKHGGKAPQTIAAAQARLRSLVEPVLEVFTEIVETWRDTRCDKCGMPTADPGPVIRIGLGVLDRSGLGPSARLTVAAEAAAESEPFADWLTNDDLMTIGDIFDAAQRRMENGEPVPERTADTQAYAGRIVGVGQDTSTPVFPRPVIDAEYVEGGE